MNEPTPTTPRLWDRAFLAFVIALATSALLPLLRTGPATSGATDVQDAGSSQLIWIAVYAVGLVLLIRQRVRLGDLARANPAVVVVCVLALASATWSDVAEITLREAVALALTTALGAYLSSRFSVEELGGVLAWTLLGIAAASAAFAIFRPQYGLDHVRGDAWRGVFTTKNELGRVMALGAVVWAARALTLRGHLIVSVLAAAFCAVVAEQSQSRTALVALALFALLFLFLPAFRAHYSIAVPAASLFGLVAIAGGYWLYESADAVLASFGTDATFTGRGRIWEAVWTMIGERPITGYGFGAFWRGIEGPSAYVWSVVGTTPPHAHSGLLDLWLQLGVAGAIAGLAVVAMALARAWRSLQQAWRFENVLPIVFVAFIVFFNFSESTFVGANSLYWLLLSYFGFAVGRRVRVAPEPASTELDPRVVGVRA
jgi:O-antigen ligase